MTRDNGRAEPGERERAEPGERGGSGAGAGAPRLSRRGRLLAAVAVVCAATVLSAPATAFAAPVLPGGAHGTHSAAGASRKALTNAELEAVRTRIDDLYREAGRATEAYNAAEERRAEQSDQVGLLSTRVARGEEQIAGLRERIGAAARAQYRDAGSGFTVEERLLLSDDPQDFLDNSELARQGQRGSKLLLDRLDRTQKRLDADKKDAAALLKRLERSRAKKAAAREEVEKRIDAAELLESRLEKKEKERLRKLEEAAAARAQAGWIDSGALRNGGAGAGGGVSAGAATVPGAAGGASAQGARAVAYATAQLGKPYVWGAEGPGSFDCSGLTSQAWLAAGRAIPRTSQEQWRQLTHVDVNRMRPGDLIIYHSDASHVGMYIGGGRIIHAPRPGRNVTVAGAGSMQILGVVRPDPEAASLPGGDKTKPGGAGESAGTGKPQARTVTPGKADDAGKDAHQKERAREPAKSRATAPKTEPAGKPGPAKRSGGAEEPDEAGKSGTGTDGAGKSGTGTDGAGKSGNAPGAPKGGGPGAGRTGADIP
ncbi:NlpC/P60 family protein [Streptomyces sp. NPDC007088]|uniref:C40 family peptidase n=1 Tax=Streptomyces sp. NPDC007088 TaxID=3364773 RepID=UPI0036A521D1